MSEHLFEKSIWIARPRAEVFEFFANATNLEKITPKWLNFRVLTPQPIDMHAGAEIKYRLSIHGLPCHWTTDITEWAPPFQFADTQRSGPYKTWHHTHRFEEEGTGTRITDVVRYELPFGPLGDLVHWLKVHRDVETIFRHRNTTILRIFAPEMSKNSATVGGHA